MLLHLMLMKDCTVECRQCMNDLMKQALLRYHAQENTRNQFVKILPF